MDRRLGSGFGQRLPHSPSLSSTSGASGSSRRYPKNAAGPFSPTSPSQDGSAPLSDLERATSVGSVSSVTSTSSLEATPFRMAPMGNVRAAYAAAAANRTAPPRPLAMSSLPSPPSPSSGRHPASRSASPVYPQSRPPLVTGNTQDSVYPAQSQSPSPPSLPVPLPSPSPSSSPVVTANSKSQSSSPPLKMSSAQSMQPSTSSCSTNSHTSPSTEFPKGRADPAPAHSRPLSLSPARPIPAALVSAPRGANASPGGHSSSLYGASVGSVSSVRTARPVPLHAPSSSHCLPSPCASPKVGDEHPLHFIQQPSQSSHSTPSRLPKQTAFDWQFRQAPGLGTRSSMAALRSARDRERERERFSATRDKHASAHVIGSTTPSGSSQTKHILPHTSANTPVGSLHTPPASTGPLAVSTYTGDQDGSNPFAVPGTTTISPELSKTPTPMRIRPLPQAQPSSPSPNPPSLDPTPRLPPSTPTSAAVTYHGMEPPSSAAMNESNGVTGKEQEHAQAEAQAYSYLAKAEHLRQHMTPAEFVKWSALNSPPPALSSASTPTAKSFSNLPSAPRAAAASALQGESPSRKHESSSPSRLLHLAYPDPASGQGRGSPVSLLSGDAGSLTRRRSYRISHASSQTVRDPLVSRAPAGFSDWAQEPSKKNAALPAHLPSPLAFKGDGQEGEALPEQNQTSFTHIEQSPTSKMDQEATPLPPVLPTVPNTPPNPKRPMVDEDGIPLESGGAVLTPEDFAGLGLRFLPPVSADAPGSTARSAAAPPIRPPPPHLRQLAEAREDDDSSSSSAAAASAAVASLSTPEIAASPGINTEYNSFAKLGNTINQDQQALADSYSGATSQNLTTDSLLWRPSFLRSLTTDSAATILSAPYPQGKDRTLDDTSRPLAAIPAPEDLTSQPSAVRTYSGNTQGAEQDPTSPFDTRRSRDEPSSTSKTNREMTAALPSDGITSASRVASMPPQTSIPFPTRGSPVLPPGTKPVEPLPTPVPDSSSSSHPTAAVPSHVHPSAEPPSSARAALLAQRRTPRTPTDFNFAELLGEGSYSSVLMAWDERSGATNVPSPLSSPNVGNENMPSSVNAGGTEKPDILDSGRRVTAAEAIAGIPAASLVSERAQAQGKTAYAVKVLDKVHIMREKKSKYVGVEKEALSRCVRLRGVVTLYWTFQDRQSLYFVLELAPHGDLHSYVRKLGSISLDLTRFWAAQIAHTLMEIHQAGVVHRDMKPENILLDAHWRIRITDFGSAKCTERDSQGKILPAFPPSKPSAGFECEEEKQVVAAAHSFVGTAEFVSPELLDSKLTTAASDWWAYGAIIYTLLAGAPPFHGPSEYTTFQKILKDPVTFPSAFPPVARAFVSAFLQRNPFDRLSENRWSKLLHHPFFISETDMQEQNDAVPSSTTSVAVGIEKGSNLDPSSRPSSEDKLPGIWTDLWTRPAPPLRPGIVVRPETPETEKNENVFALFDTESEPAPTEDERHSASAHSHSHSHPHSSQSNFYPRSHPYSSHAATGGGGEDDADNEDEGSSIAPSGYESSLHQKTSAMEPALRAALTPKGHEGKPSAVFAPERNKAGGMPARSSALAMQRVDSESSSSLSDSAGVGQSTQDGKIGIGIGGAGPVPSTGSGVNGASMSGPSPSKAREKKSTKLRHKAKRQLSRALLGVTAEEPSSNPGRGRDLPSPLPNGVSVPSSTVSYASGPAPALTSASSTPGLTAIPSPNLPKKAMPVTGNSTPARTINSSAVQYGASSPALGSPAALSFNQATLSKPSGSHLFPTVAGKLAQMQDQEGSVNSSPSRLFPRRSSARNVNSLAFQVNDPPISPSKEIRDPGSFAQSADSADKGARADVAWHLRRGENMVLAAPVLQRKSGAAYLFSPKRRDLVLTDQGRLVSVKPPLGQGVLKDEFVLTSWAAAGATDAFRFSDLGGDAADADRSQHSGPEMMVSLEPKGGKVFVLTTSSKRQFVYEDPSGDNSYWLRAIRRVMESAPPSAS